MPLPIDIGGFTAARQAKHTPELRGTSDIYTALLNSTALNATFYKINLGTGTAQIASQYPAAGDDWCRRSTRLTGDADGKKFTCAFMLRIDGGNGTQRCIREIVNNRLSIELTTANKIYFRLGTTSTIACEAETNAAFLAGSSYLAIGFSLDAAAGLCKLRVDNVDELNQITLNDQTIDFTWVDHAFGARFNSQNKCDCTITEYYENQSEYLDIGIQTNWDKLFDGNNISADYGIDGSAITGSQPIVYLEDADGDTNLGFGGTMPQQNPPVTKIDGPGVGNVSLAATSAAFLVAAVSQTCYRISDTLHTSWQGAGSDVGYAAFNLATDAIGNESTILTGGQQPPLYGVDMAVDDTGRIVVIYHLAARVMGINYARPAIAHSLNGLTWTNGIVLSAAGAASQRNGRTAVDSTNRFISVFVDENDRIWYRPWSNASGLGTLRDTGFDTSADNCPIGNGIIIDRTGEKARFIYKNAINQIHVLAFDLPGSFDGAPTFTSQLIDTNAPLTNAGGTPAFGLAADGSTIYAMWARSSDGDLYVDNDGDADTWAGGVLTFTGTINHVSPNVYDLDGQQLAHVIDDAGQTKYDQDSIGIPGLLQIISETLNITELPIFTRGKTALVPEVMQISETSVTARLLVRIRDEALQLGDNYSRCLRSVRIRGETVQISEIAVLTVGKFRVIDETMEIIENVIESIAGQIIQIRNETLQIIENTVRSSIVLRIRDEANSISENNVLSRALNRIREETVSITDDSALARILVRIRDETNAISETIIEILAAIGADLVRVIDETVQIAETAIGSVAEMIAKVIDETIQVAETIVSLTEEMISKVVNETVNVIEGIEKSLARVRAILEVVGIQENISRASAFIRLVSETVSITEANIRSRLRILIVSSIVSIGEAINYVVSAFEPYVPKIDLIGRKRSPIEANAMQRDSIGLAARLRGAIKLKGTPDK